MKIVIIGYSGSGKSTLAKRLAQEHGIEPLYLDRVHFLPDWAEREPESAREIVWAEMQKPDWVIDGNYTHMHREERLREADEIIFLNYPRITVITSYSIHYTKLYEYHSDMTRTFAIGSIDAQSKEIYEIVKTAQQMALDVLKSGIPGKVVITSYSIHYTKLYDSRSPASG